MNTVANSTQAEYTVDKSRFIAYVSPIKTRGEADGFFADIRSLHKNATHNVPAFILGSKQEQAYASDDNEPGGTAGTPILSYLLAQELTNLCLVVTRYFGGIKLGTGGLVRAYTKSARLAVAAAGIIELKETKVLDIEIEYPLLAPIEAMEKKDLFVIEGIVYQDKVRLSLAIEINKFDLVKSRLDALLNVNYFC